MALALFLGLAALVVLTPLNEARSGGISNSDSSNGCTCHDGSSDSQVIPTLEGLPQRYRPDTTYRVYLNFTGGPAAGGSNHGGFNLKASGGTLAPRSGDNTVQSKSDGSLTHTSAGNDQRAWEADWTAPDTTQGNVTFTLQVNSVNGDGSASSSDKWNRLVVKVPPSVVDVGLKDLDLPGNAGEDEAVYFSLTVVNEGNEDLADIDIVATMKLEDTEVWNDTYVVSELHAIEETQVNGQWTGGPEGDYTLEVTVDHPEDAEDSNDRLEGDVSVAEVYLDITVMIIDAPSEGMEGENATFGVLVDNPGTEDVSDVVVEVSLFRSSTLVWSDNDTIAQLLSGENVTLTWTILWEAPGTHRIEVSTDFSDANMANNEFTVGNISVIANVTDGAVSLEEVPAKVDVNTSASFNVTVENLGTISLQDAMLTLEALINGTVVWTHQVNLTALDPGSNITSSYTWPGGQEGNYTLRVTLSHPWDENTVNDVDEQTLMVEKTADPDPDPDPNNGGDGDDDGDDSPGLPLLASVGVLGGLALLVGSRRKD